MRPTHLCLALALTCGFATSAFAQEAGVKAGVNIATIDFETLSRQIVPNNRIALAGGLFARTTARRRFSIQGEALLSMKGTDYLEDPGEPDEEDVTIELTYLELPLLVRYDAPGASGVHLFAGPAFAIRLSAKENNRFDDEIEDRSELIRPWDLGLVVGAGVTRGRFVADARYQWGLISILDPDVPVVNDWKNRAFTLMAGVRF